MRYVVKNDLIIITMKFLKRFTLLSVIMLLFSSCGVSVSMINSAYQSKSEDAHIDVYYTKRPSCEYIEIAKLTSNIGFENTDMDKIKSKANELGADGIIIIGQASTNSYAIGSVLFTENSGITAIAIKYM